MPASAADAPAGASSNPSVWYASFGSNIVSERFACYLEGGRIEGMIRDMPGSRDPSPPTEWRRWDDLPHRLFFAHSSPTWDGGGVAFAGVPGVKPEVEPKPKPPFVRTSLLHERNVPRERPRWALRTASTA
jgi:histone deacetylase 6